jgi:peptidoglycan/LPS O-acetylase OafA/YrhL
MAATVITMRVPSSNRRLDIQGLRALAVIVVVAFHAGLPVPGGFVGVDVFFVISGFVITAMLFREQSLSGRIRFGQFYLKRFKRLTPALALMVSVTLLASAIILSPMGSQQIVAETGAGAILLVANLVISSNTGDYFDSVAELNPLLNTWSLSVEEQFYLVFPAVLAFGWFMARRRVRLSYLTFGLIIGIAIFSFGLTLAGSKGLALHGIEGLIGFYSPLARAWEFALGALLSLTLERFTPNLSSRFSFVIAVIGIAMIASSLWLITENTTFPGFWTLLPTMGTLFILFAGIRQNPISDALSFRPMVKIGDWSYSIYLWHWPFIVFSIYLWPLSPHVAIAAAIISLGPALASYYWLEQPVRQSQTPTRLRAARLIAIVIGPPLLLAAMLFVTATFYWQPKYVSGEVKGLYQGDVRDVHYEFWTYSMGPYFPCDADALNLGDFFYGTTRERCAQSKLNVPVNVAIVGDSHAAHLFYGLANALPERNVGYFALAGTPPLKNASRESLLLEQIARNPSIETVILNANWGAYSNITESELKQTLLMFEDSGKKVFITDGIPQFPISAFDCKYQYAIMASNDRCELDVNYFTPSYNSYLKLIDKVVSELSNSHLISTFKSFCTKKSCSMIPNGELLYGDEGHLNHQGSDYLARLILENDAKFIREIRKQ